MPSASNSISKTCFKWVTQLSLVFMWCMQPSSSKESKLRNLVSRLHFPLDVFYKTLHRLDWEDLHMNFMYLANRSLMSSKGKYPELLMHCALWNEAMHLRHFLVSVQRKWYRVSKFRSINSCNQLKCWQNLNYKESILNILKPEDTEEGSKNKPFESSRCTYLLHPFSDSAVSELTLLIKKMKTLKLSEGKIELENLKRLME